MPKRKAGETETDYLKRKLRRLQKKIKKLPSEPTLPLPIQAESQPSSREASPQLELTPKKPEEINTEANTEDLIEDDDVLPEEFLLALGTEGEDTEERGQEIRPELAARWTKLMCVGLDKEAQEQLVKKYPAPTNLYKEAPKINPEITASLSEISLKRDKRIVHRQNLTLKVMYALGKTLTSVLKGNINSKAVIEEVNDAAKLCCQIFHEDSSSRKFFALSGANQTIKEAVRGEKPDEYLFGKDCGEKIKAAQVIKKTGAQIKAPETNNNKTPATKQQQPRRQGNWKGPPPQYQHQRTRGGHRQAPATRRYQGPHRDQKRSQHRSRHTHRR